MGGLTRAGDSFWGQGLRGRVDFIGYDPAPADRRRHQPVDVDAERRRNARELLSGIDRDVEVTVGASLKLQYEELGPGLEPTPVEQEPEIVENDAGDREVR